MLKLFSSPSPRLQKAVRVGFATALLANFVAVATVSIASTLDNGKDVGAKCYTDHYNYNDPGADGIDPIGSDIQQCITDLCHTRPTGQEAADCARKARYEVARKMGLIADNPSVATS